MSFWNGEDYDNNGEWEDPLDAARGIIFGLLIMTAVVTVLIVGGLLWAKGGI